MCRQTDGGMLHTFSGTSCHSLAMLDLFLARKCDGILCVCVSVSAIESGKMMEIYEFAFSSHLFFGVIFSSECVRVCVRR